MSLYCVCPNTKGQRQEALEASEPSLMAPSWTSGLHKKRSYMLFVICQQLVRCGHHMLSHACQRALCSEFVPQIELIHRDLGHTQAMGEKGHTKMNPWRDVSTETFLLQISVPLAMTVQMDPGQLPCFLQISYSLHPTL